MIVSSDDEAMKQASKSLVGTLANGCIVLKCINPQLILTKSIFPGM